MNPFTTHTGLVVPLDRAHVNTDDIIPARFLKTIKRTGFADALFANWRYQNDDCTPDPAFALNQPRYEDGSILLARENFGCGSSREHAPWAILEYGFRCIIAPSFADIFYNNCFNNGILPIMLNSTVIESLFHATQTADRYMLNVDLAAQTITTPEHALLPFEIDQFKRLALLQGLDHIGWTLSHQDEITAYEEHRRQETPWLFLRSLPQRHPDLRHDYSISRHRYTLKWNRFASSKAF